MVALGFSKDWNLNSKMDSICHNCVETFLLLKMIQKHFASFFGFRAVVFRSRSPGVQQQRLLELLAPFSFTHRWRSGWPNPEEGLAGF